MSALPRRPILDGEGNFIPELNDETNSDYSDGSHRYGYMVDGLWDWNGNVYNENAPVAREPGSGGTLYKFLNRRTN